MTSNKNFTSDTICRVQMKKFLILFLLSLFLFNSTVDRAHSYELRDINGLKAFSLSAAKKAIESGSRNKEEIFSVGFITKVWAVLLDTNEGLIVVGESDPRIPPLLLDDVAVALQTIDNINTGENPGVSIEPISIDKYEPFQRVIYYGGIDSTNYGRICYEADLLLKRLALGFEQTGIVGFPSEWDLSIDNAKSGRKLNPWERSVGRSWFFPLQVRIAHKYNCATVTALTMEVRTDLEEELEMPREFIPVDSKVLTDILKDNREAVSVIFARLFTQHYEKISLRFPVLVQLKNLLALSGMLAELLKETTMNDFDYWRNEFHVENTDNHKKVPTLSRGVNGLGYSQFMSGGLSVTYRTEDAWTDAVISRNPKYLKQAVLKSRPSPDAVSWVIPLNQGSPKEWSDSLLIAINSASKDPFITTEQHFKMPIRTVGASPQNTTPGWHPATQADNLIGLKARLYFSTGGFEAFSPDGRFSVAGAEISIGIPIDFQFVFKNRFELSLTIPLIFRIKFEDRPARLPGFKDNLIAYAAGVESPILTNRIQLFTGVKKGRWRLPSVVLENSVVIPENRKILEEISREADFGAPIRVRFGTDDWHGSHALQMQIPVKRDLSLSGFSEFQTDWRGSLLGDRIIVGGAMNWRLEADVGISLGLHYRTSLVRQENSLFPLDEAPASWVSEGDQFLISLSSPTRSGRNSISIGWYAPSNRPDLGGVFLMSIDLSGTSLFDRRFWF